MTGGADAGKWRAIAGRVGAGLGAMALLGCPPAGDANAPAADAVAEVAKASGVASRDQVLSVPLERDLVIHRFEAAVQGTSPEGDVRLHVEHGPDEDPLKAAAVVKDVLAARGWRVSGERHFERAIEVRLDRGGSPAEPQEVRVVYLIRRSGRLVTCDGLADADAADALGDAFRALCQEVTVAPPAAPSDAPAETQPLP